MAEKRSLNFTNLAKGSVFGDANKLNAGYWQCESASPLRSWKRWQTAPKIRDRRRPSNFKRGIKKKKKTFLGGMTTQGTTAGRLSKRAPEPGFTWLSLAPSMTLEFSADSTTPTRTCLVLWCFHCRDRRIALARGGWSPAKQPFTPELCVWCVEHALLRGHALTVHHSFPALVAALAAAL